MSQFARVFSSSRIPGKTVDSLQTTPSNDTIIVIVKQRYFVVPTTTSDGQQISSAAFRVLFEQCHRLADVENDVAAREQTNVGVLTGGDRTRWAEARELLMP